MKSGMCPHNSSRGNCAHTPPSLGQISCGGNRRTCVHFCVMTQACEGLGQLVRLPRLGNALQFNGNLETASAAPGCRCRHGRRKHKRAVGRPLCFGDLCESALLQEAADDTRCDGAHGRCRAEQRLHCGYAVAVVTPWEIPERGERAQFPEDRTAVFAQKVFWPKENKK